MLNVNNISVIHNKRHLLRDVSFHANAGELLVVLGSNGAGKSSLLKCISKEWKPQQGDVSWNNISLTKWTDKSLAKVRAVLTQNYQISLPFGVEEIVMMGRYPHFKNSPSELDRHTVQQCLRYTGIEHLQSRNYLTLSGGEQQRVQIARILAQLWDGDANNKLMLLDEPVSALDIQYQHSVMQLAKKLTLRGFTVVAVLHDLNLALQYADKVLMLKQGRQVAFGDLGVLNEHNIREVYEVDTEIIQHPDSKRKLVVVKM